METQNQNSRNTKNEGVPTATDTNSEQRQEVMSVKQIDNDKVQILLTGLDAIELYSLIERLDEISCNALESYQKDFARMFQDSILKDPSKENMFRSFNLSGFADDTIITIVSARNFLNRFAPVITKAAGDLFTKEFEDGKEVVF
jgi:hypothetical protein